LNGKNWTRSKNSDPQEKFVALPPGVYYGIPKVYTRAHRRGILGDTPNEFHDSSYKIS